MTSLPSLLQALGVPGQYLVLIAALCGVAAALMPWLPVPATSGSAYALAYRALNFLAQNYGKAANATPASNSQG